MSSVTGNGAPNKKKDAAKKPSPTQPPGKAGQVDWREQTFNGGLAGTIEQVSTQADLITKLRMVMVDIDPKYLAPALYQTGKGSDAWCLYEHTVKHWLNRHPLWTNAEVRHSGTGLHVLLHLEPFVEFESSINRDRWAAIVRALQNTLPSDPNAPCLTALTRPVDSTNSKSNRRVTQLRAGTPVSPTALLDFVDQLRLRPFATIAYILYGTDRIAPCPICKMDGNTLAALDRVGRCYARCGMVKLAQLFGTFMSVPSAQEED
jgi:hypothetical protein